MDTDLRKEVIESYDSDLLMKALEEFDLDPVFGLLHINNFTEIDGVHAVAVLWAVEEIKRLQLKISEVEAENEYLRLQELQQHKGLSSNG